MPLSQLPPPADLNTLVRNVGHVYVSISPQETTEDANHRRQEATDEARHRRWREKIIFVLTVAGIAAVYIAGLGIMVFGTQSPDEKKLWGGVLVSLTTGLVGYALGKK